MDEMVVLCHPEAFATLRVVIYVFGEIFEDDAMAR
jgi:hypothetical protein